MTRDVQKPADDVTAARIEHTGALIAAHCAAIRKGVLDSGELAGKIEADFAALLTDIGRGNDNAVRDALVQR